MDVDTAYLNANLQEPIYMCQLPGYNEGTQDSVLLLKKGLYGLKQLGREWYKCLCRVLAITGFKKSSSDAAVFCRHIRGNYTIIAAAIDDLTITAPTDAILFGVKEDLIKAFRMKDLGEIHWLLNLKIERDREKRTLSFSQQAYIERILERFNLQDAKTYATPLDPNVKLTKDQCPTTNEEKERMKKVPYRQAISSLMWTAVAT